MAYGFGCWVAFHSGEGDLDENQNESEGGRIRFESQPDLDDRAEGEDNRKGRRW